MEFLSVRSSEVLSSEQELREYRHQEVGRAMETANCRWVMWGHHQDDFLETQMLRLIRGTGVQGLLPMVWAQGKNLRPLLEFSKAELLAEAKEKGLHFQEDPSNQELDYLRNWLRQEWLPNLEDKCPGALQSLSRSMKHITDLLQESHGHLWPEHLWEGESLSRPIFLTLKATQKTQCLAVYLRKLGAKNYTQNHIHEIMKHLDIAQNEHRFDCAQMTWSLTRDRIEARPVSRS